MYTIKLSSYGCRVALSRCYTSNYRQHGFLHARTPHKLKINYAHLFPCHVQQVPPPFPSVPLFHTARVLLSVQTATCKLLGLTAAHTMSLESSRTLSSANDTLALRNADIRKCPTPRLLTWTPPGWQSQACSCNPPPSPAVHVVDLAPDQLHRPSNLHFRALCRRKPSPELEFSDLGALHLEVSNWCPPS